jgi:DNA topoisomerase-1
VKKGADSRSLLTEEQIFSVTLDEALTIFAQPKQRGRRAAAPPLRDLGTDPSTGRPVVIKDGRFGAYITDGETNATVPRSSDPLTISVDRAFDLLAEKRAAGPAPAKKTAKRTTKKAAAKRTTKKSAARRSSS